MTTYVRDNIKYSAHDVRVLLNASFSDNADLSEFGFYVFEETDPPAALPGHRVVGSIADNQRVWTQEPVAVMAPEEVTMRQFRLALLQTGRLHDVDAAIESMDEPQRSAAQIEWQYSTNVNRNSEFISSLAVALDLGDQGIKDMFSLAATL